MQPRTAFTTFKPENTHLSVYKLRIDFLTVQSFEVHKAALLLEL